MTLVDRIMFGGERICVKKECRTMIGYVEIDKDSKKIILGRYNDSRGDSYKIKPGGKFAREEIEFTTVSESGYIIDFKARRDSRGWYNGIFQGQRQSGKIKIKIENCGRDVYGKRKY